MKRLIDILLSIGGLLVFLPLLVLVSICIKLDSHGPIFYRGWRAGRWGRPFRIFKFRTMVPDAEKLGGSETPDDDPRITRIGYFLRSYKLDELPQLLNVLKGEMSLVGPRPEVLEEVASYTPEERELLMVRPGMTDWASLKFHHEGRITRGSDNPHLVYHRVIRPEKVRLGLEYVRHHSLLDDFCIIARTLRAIFE